MTAPHSPWVVLAHLLRPQGRKGELLAELLTDFPNRFHERSMVFLASPDFDGTAADARSVEVASFWLPVGRNEGRIVLKFDGVNSINEAEELAGLDVLVPAEERMPLEADSVYISELTGCTVYDGATVIGVVTGVEFPSTPDGVRRLEEAAPLLEVAAPNGGEILIPFVQAFLVHLDVEAKRIEMALPIGLVDVNASQKR